MNTQQANLMEIFYIIDEFCKSFDQTIKKHSLSADANKKTRNKKSKLSPSEVITILVLFHTGGYRNLKHFYLFYVSKHMTKEFPTQVSYNRFVELQKKAMLPMTIAAWLNVLEFHLLIQLKLQSAKTKGLKGIKYFRELQQ